MLKTIEAVFDGKVFLPTKTVPLTPNTRVKITIESLLDDGDEVVSFLQTARSLNLDGPPDWSVNLDEYLYGEKVPNDS